MQLQRMQTYSKRIQLYEIIRTRKSLLYAYKFAYQKHMTTYISLLTSRQRI